MNKERAREELALMRDNLKMGLQETQTTHWTDNKTTYDKRVELLTDNIQALDIAIECVEEKIKREKNAHRGKHKAYWTYTGNGTDSGTGLEIQCSYCGKKYNIFNADETKPFSYKKYQECLDEHCMRECPNCKREMIGWRKHYLSHEKPTPIRYYKESEKE